MSKNVAYMKIIIYLSRPVSVVIIDTNPIKSKLSQMEMSSIIAINLAENVIWAISCNCWKFQ